MTQPKISIVVPIYNVQDYLRECLGSIQKQTLHDIEIICINDGSIDCSYPIIMEYAFEDSRFKVIDKQNSGYGDSVNVGIAAATGKYIGIVEPDDYIKPNMYEALLKIAEENDLDFVKADNIKFSRRGERQHEVLRRHFHDRTLYEKVLTDEDKDESFIRYTHSAIWSGIYSRDFLDRFNIRLDPTPGASFQDIGFNFLTYMYARRCWFTSKPYYYYRVGHATQSVALPEKSRCVLDEYDFIEKHYQAYENKTPMLEKMLWYQKDRDLFWALSRLPYVQRIAFAPEMVRLLQDPPPESLSEEDLDRIMRFCADPVAYVVSSLACQYAKLCNSKELRLGRFLLKYHKLIKKAIKKILKRP